MKNYHKGLLLVLSTAIISGVSIFLNKFGVKGIEPSLFAGLKNLSVGLIIVAVIILSRDWKKLYVLPRTAWIKLLLVGLVGGSVPFILFFNGLALTTGVKAGFIHKTLFIYVALISVLFLKEKITAKIGIGLVAMLIGLVFFLKITPQALAFGDLLVLIATLLWAVEIAISKRLLDNISPSIVAGARMLFGGGFIWIYLLLTGKLHTIALLGAPHMNWVLLTTLFLAGYVLTFYHGLKHVPAHVATSILALGAPITLLLQVIFSEKAISLQQIGGMGIISLALILIARARFFNKEKVYYVFQRDN